MDKSGLSAGFGIDRGRIVRLIAGISPDGQVDARYDGWFLSTVAPLLFALGPEIPEDELDPESLPPKERKDWSDGEKTRVNLQKEMKNLIPADVHRREMALIITEIVNEFESFPDIIERDCGATTEVVLKAQQTVDRVRMGAYERIVNLPK